MLIGDAGLPSRLKSFLASRPCLAPNFSANSISLGVLPHLIFIQRVVAGKSVCGWLCALACAANAAAGRLRMTTKNSLDQSTENVLDQSGFNMSLPVTTSAYHTSQFRRCHMKEMKQAQTKPIFIGQISIIDVKTAECVGKIMDVYFFDFE